MVGTGNLGRALLGYKGFSHQGFRIVAAFDVDPAQVGGTIEGVRSLSPRSTCPTWRPNIASSWA